MTRGRWFKWLRRRIDGRRNLFPSRSDARVTVRPTIRRKNLYRRYLAKAIELARQWSKRYPGMEAMMLTGGVARGYADEHSELDLTVFLGPPTYRSWVLLSRSPLAEGDNLVDGTYVDTHLTTIPVERKRVWGALDLWDASFAKILVDRRGRLAKLLREKIVPSPSSWRLHEEAIEAEWFAELGVDWIDRTDLVAAHHLMNHAFDRFLFLLFEAQGERFPFDKWQMHLSRSLRVLPPRYEAQAREWLSVRSFTARDVRRRARVAGTLMHWWRAAFRNAWRGSKVRDAIVALRSGPISLENFQRRFGEHTRLQFPLRAVTSMKRERGRWVVSLDAHALERAVKGPIPGMLEYQRERLLLAAGS